MKTPIVPTNNLGSDLAGKPVNKTSYRGMIRLLMYLTATRPNIQFSTVLCARYQYNPKASHLTGVKRILKYLKGTPTLGLYYPKYSGFDLKGYLDSDYAGCNVDRKAPQVPVKYLVVNWFVGVLRSSMDVVFDDAFGGVGDEEVVVGGGLEEEALVEFMVELSEEDEDGRKNEKDGLFNLKANDQSRKA
ncbi:hypothetical protein Tco_0168222 [Tanacetum coccineum]